MNKEEIKEKLSVFRPGTDDEQDPFFKDALDYLKEDSDLATWFELEKSFDGAVRDKVAEIPVPADLKAQIIQASNGLDSVENKGESDPIIQLDERQKPRNFGFLYAMAAVLVAGFFILPSLLNPEGGGMSVAESKNWPNAMASWLTRDYPSNVQRASSIQEAKSYFQEKHTLSYPEFDSQLALTQMPLVGCQAINWSDKTVFLTCFRFENTVVHLMVLPGLEDGLSTHPKFQDFGSKANQHYQAAAWTDGSQSYMLITDSKSNGIIDRFLGEMNLPPAVAFISRIPYSIALVNNDYSRF